MTAEAEVSRSGSARAPRRRIASIDILRGLTMLVMIFVNDLDDVHGLPWWTHHAHAWENRMTYVDMVFPFFLFLVGMSMPLAVEQRLRRNGSRIALWRHILFRSAGLIVLGLILANGERFVPAIAPISWAAWGLLGVVGGILFWIAPARTDRNAMAVRVLRVLGLCLLVFVYAVFRRNEHGQLRWIDGSYPEILGLIGYAYLSAAILYVPTRRWKWAPMGWFAAVTALCAFTVLEPKFFLLDKPLYVWPFGNGSSLSLILAGIATSNLFFNDLGPGANGPEPRLRTKNLQALGFAVAALVAAVLLTPLGISKIRATPSWCLFTIAAAAAIFTLLHWVCDVRGKQGWAFWVRPAGANTLLTYLLPDLYFYGTALVGFHYFGTHLNAGWVGVVVTLGFTASMLAIAWLLTRLGLRLQL